MPNETDQKMMEILRILADREDILGAKTIAEELKRKGYNLGERAVRYHMRILDEKEFTERIGYAGRKITSKGFNELKKGLIYDQVDFIFSKFEGMIYQTTLDPVSAQGKVVVNTSSFINNPEAMGIIKEIFQSGLSVSPLVKISEKINEKTLEKELLMKTICGTTIDGMLLNEGIPVMPQYGGIVNVEDYIPTHFTELIAYQKTSMTPLEAFTDREMTSVLKVVREGDGVIPANFRIIPGNSKERAEKMFQKLENIGISGLIKIGDNPESSISDNISIAYGLAR
jgi:hypothetical protein